MPLGVDRPASDATGTSSVSFRTEGMPVHPGQRRYDQFAWLGTHNSFANLSRYVLLQNQNLSVPDQLRAGVRYVQFDLWLVRQKLTLLGDLYFEYYTGPDTSPSNEFSNVPLQVVAAHIDNDSGLFVRPSRWMLFQSAEQAFREVNDFLSGEGSDAVVTIGLETHVHSTKAGRIDNAKAASGLADRQFSLKEENPGIPAPYDQRGGWHVRRYGMPPVALMTAHGKNVVFLGGKHEVKTVDGDDSVESGTWASRSARSQPIDDFSREMFRMPHSSTLPSPGAAAHNNTYSLLREKRSDIVARWHRIPNIATFDFVELGQTRLFTSEDLESLWRETITPEVELDQSPSPSGWFNTDVRVVRVSSVEGVPVQAVVAASWNSDEPPAVEGPADYRRYSTDHPDIVLSGEGRHTLGVTAIDASYGRRSTHTLVPIWIDTIPPDLAAGTDPISLWPPNGRSVAVRVSGTVSDTGSELSDDAVSYGVQDEYGEIALSGIAAADSAGGFAFSVELRARRRGDDRDGRIYRIEVRAKDNADNTATRTIDVTVPHDRRDR